MAREKHNHLWIHAGLISFTLVAIYPVLWVLALAFSGQQSVGLIDLPKDPSFLERARGILPWPAHLSVSGRVDTTGGFVFTRRCGDPGLVRSSDERRVAGG